MAIAFDQRNHVLAHHADRVSLASRLRTFLHRWPKRDPAWDDVVAKKSDRLLADVGLTRREALGANGYFWHEWNRLREPWSL